MIKYNGALTGYEQGRHIMKRFLYSIIRACKKFNWTALAIWLAILVISVLPMGISLLDAAVDDQAIDYNFWGKCLYNQDMMWMFATLVLFAVFNHVSGNKGKFGTTAVIGIVVFILTELLWLYFKFNSEAEAIQYESWMIDIGIYCASASVIISTPLQINFVKE